MTNAIYLARQHAFRAPDAMQFAAANQSRVAVVGGAFVFVTSDKELLAAARASRLRTLDPETEEAMKQLRQLRSHEAKQR